MSHSTTTKAKYVHQQKLPLPRRPELNSRAAHVGCITDKEVQRKTFVWVLPFFPAKYNFTTFLFHFQREITCVWED
jgi:hypothetical protein